MKVTNRFLSVLLIAFLITVTFGCVEHRYYRDHQSHSPEWNHRHHRDGARVDVDIHN